MGEKKIIPALTGIRAFCVYCIFFKHFNFFSPISHPHFHLFLNQFYAFLNFFFVLSGFLIYYIYAEIGNLNRIKLYNYFVNRFSRVFPILIILISLTFLLTYNHYSGKEGIKLYLLNITLLKGFSSVYHLTGIGPSWTLSVEELFYLLSPLIFMLVKNIPSLLKFVILSYTAGLLITLFFSLFPFEGYFGSIHFTAYSTFFGRAFEFACGIYLGMLVKGTLQNKFLNRLGKKVHYLGLSLVGTSLFLLYLIALLNKTDTAINTWSGIAVNHLLLPVGITLTFFSLVYHKSLLQRILSSPLMIHLGNATYSFYLLHTSFLLSLIFKYISRNIFIVFVIMIIVSLIFHKTIEQPLAIFCRRRLSWKEKAQKKVAI